MVVSTLIAWLFSWLAAVAVAELKRPDVEFEIAHKYENVIYGENAGQDLASTD